MLAAVNTTVGGRVPTGSGVGSGFGGGSTGVGPGGASSTITVMLFSRVVPLSNAACKVYCPVRARVKVRAPCPATLGPVSVRACTPVKAHFKVMACPATNVLGGDREGGPRRPPPGSGVGSGVGGGGRSRRLHGLTAFGLPDDEGGNVMVVGHPAAHDDIRRAFGAPGPRALLASFGAEAVPDIDVSPARAGLGSQAARSRCSRRHPAWRTHPASKRIWIPVLTGWPSRSSTRANKLWSAPPSSK